MGLFIRRTNNNVFHDDDDDEEIVLLKTDEHNVFDDVDDGDVELVQTFVMFMLPIWMNIKSKMKSSATMMTMVMLL